MLIFLFISLLIAVLAVIFALQNVGPVTVAFLLWNFQGSLALVLLIAVGAGILVSLLASLPALIRTSWRVTSQKRKLSELEASLADHRRMLTEAQNKLAELEAPGPVPDTPPPA